MTMQRSALALALMASLSMTLAACGGGDDDGPPNDTPAAEGGGAPGTPSNGPESGGGTGGGSSGAGEGAAGGSSGDGAGGASGGASGDGSGTGSTDGSAGGGTDGGGTGGNGTGGGAGSGGTGGTTEEPSGGTGGGSTGGAGDPAEPGPMGGDSGECFGAGLYRVGTTYSLDYTVSGTLSGTSSSAGSITRNTTFNGHPAVEISLDNVTRYSGMPPTSVKVQHYAAQADGRVIEQYGNRTVASVSGMQTTTVVTFEPTFRSRMWALAEGETQEYRYDMATETTITGAPVPVPPQSSRSTVAGSMTYEGRQSVTVPLGTFNACVFLEKSDGTETRQWYAPGAAAGIMVKSVSRTAEGSLTLEMTAGTLNGASVRP